jgi:hypothetical protein
MTQRYMHLSPVALDEAIRLLDQPVRRRPASEARSGCGDILATEGGQQN